MPHKITFKSIWEVTKAAAKGFSEDKVPKLSASLAYYTVFSLGPMIVIIIFICGKIFGQDAIEGTIYEQMRSFVGESAAKQVQEIIKNASLGDKSGAAAWIGGVTLLIGATTVFGELQDSINQIWGLKAKPKAGILKLVLDRLLSFGLITTLGFLLLVSLGVTAIIEALGGKLEAMFPEVGVWVIYAINLIVTAGVITGLFMIIFRVLPDARLGWKDVLGGAIATAVLFLIGKFLISFYIAKSDIGSTYGTAGSLIILITWIYYSSIILYFGAEFTKAYAIKFGGAIHPSKFAVIAKTVTIEGEDATVQEAEKAKAREHKKRNGHAEQKGVQWRNYQPPHLSKQKSQREYGYNEAPLGMIDLVSALGMAAVMKLNDWAEGTGEEVKGEGVQRFRGEPVKR